MFRNVEDKKFLEKGSSCHRAAPAPAVGIWLVWDYQSNTPTEINIAKIDAADAKMKTMKRKQ